MSTQEFSYKGKKVTIDQEEETATVKIDRKKFNFRLHQGNLPMWKCDAAYLMFPELKDAAKHLIDYWYIVTSPNTAPMAKSHE
jgi:hypothetical protein